MRPGAIRWRPASARWSPTRGRCTSEPSIEEPPLKADPFAQLKLLDLQEIDARLLQLRHQRANLPESAEIASLEATRKEVDDEARDARIKRDDLALAQKKADADVESVKARRQRDQQRIDSGAISNPKDIERMQHELANLDKRISVLEDEELEVMEQLEEAQGVVAEMEERVAAHDERLAELATVREAKTTDIDRDIEAATQERTPVLESIPEDLLKLYDRLREKNGGIGAAELRARQCGGCRLALDAGELSRIRGLAAEEVVRCEECSRILVRTAESGL